MMWGVGGYTSNVEGNHQECGAMMINVVTFNIKAIQFYIAA